MNNYLYFDIETIPTQNAAVRADIAANMPPPSRMSKPETIAAWEKNDKPAAVDEAVAKTSFDGAYGHVCCIGWALGCGTPESAHIGSRIENEKPILERFFSALPQLNVPTIVGHNVIAFDLRFIWQRAIVLGVRVPSWFPRDPRPWNGEVFDTMLAFAGQRGTIGLDRLAKALGIEGKKDIDGSMVAGMWANGRHDEIAAYCRDDVALTRDIHRRFMIALGEAV